MAAISSVSASSTTVASEHTTSMNSNKDDRKLAQRLLLDFLIITIFILPIPICEFALQPYRRGFFCNDETLSYPFHTNTVTPVILGLLVGFVPALTIIIVELLRFYRRGQMDDAVFIFDFKIPTWLLECTQQFVYYAVGLVLTFDATEVGKYTIGRLRPHFMAVCQPKFADGSTCADAKNQYHYIENYMCEAKGYTALDVIESRRSFPSGHSSLAFYGMIYIAIYLQYRLRRRGSMLMRNFLQFLAISIAWFTALSRITDNWHHWSDVLVGSLIGILGACLTARIVAKFQRKRSTEFMLCRRNMNSVNVNSLKISIPRQDTSATLDEVISTPPPYILDTTNSFHNEQYCTKV